MTDQEYDTETLRHELGRLGYRVESHGERPGPYPKDERKIWEYYPPDRDRRTGLMTTLGNREAHTWLAALEHARKDKSLLSGIITIIEKTTGCQVAFSLSTSGNYGCRLLDDENPMHRFGPDPFNAAFVLWEAVCLRPGEST